MTLVAKLKRLFHWNYFIVLIIPVLIIQTSPKVLGLSNSQQSLFSSGVYYYDVAYADCSTTLKGSDNQQQAFNYFVQKGLSTTQSAGILGNLMQESHVSPSSTQLNGPGRGIAQWSEPGRWDTLLKFASNRSEDPLALSTQLDFMWAELNSSNYASVLAAVRNTVSLSDATTVFEQGYEKAGTPVMDSRINYAQQILALYGGSVITNGLAVVGQIGCGSAVNCAVDASENSGLSQVRQSVVCIAQQELSAWTPLPSIPRMGYLKYSQNAPEEWCADFASWVYDQANYPLRADPSWRFSSVFEIKQVGDKNINFHYHDSNSYTPQPGDLAIHSTSSNAYYHVNIVVDVNITSKTITLIGGDQGSGPYGGNASQSVVSTETVTGYSSGDITGYVSPD